MYLNLLRGLLSIPTGLILWLIIFASCTQNHEAGVNNNDQILAVEKEFMEKVNTWGIRDAFIHFADDSAVLVRNNQLIKGKKAIYSFFEKSMYKDIRLTWSPDYVDVSGSGDMAYTYGTYHFSAVDSTGKEVTSEGIFHTVWKKQPDGNWKYVYD